MMSNRTVWNRLGIIFLQGKVSIFRLELWALPKLEHASIFFTFHVKSVGYFLIRSLLAEAEDANILISMKIPIDSFSSGKGCMRGWKRLVNSNWFARYVYWFQLWCENDGNRIWKLLSHIYFPLLSSPCFGFGFTGRGRTLFTSNENWKRSTGFSISINLPKLNLHYARCSLRLTWRSISWNTNWYPNFSLGAFCCSFLGTRQWAMFALNESIFLSPVATRVAYLVEKWNCKRQTTLNKMHDN